MMTISKKAELFDKAYSKIIESKEIITLRDLSKSVAAVGLWGNY